MFDIADLYDIDDIPDNLDILDILNTLDTLDILDVLDILDTIDILDIFDILDILDILDKLVILVILVILFYLQVEQCLFTFIKFHYYMKKNKLSNVGEKLRCCSSSFSSSAIYSVPCFTVLSVRFSTCSALQFCKI